MFSLISVSKEGLSEDELIQIIGTTTILFIPYHEGAPRMSFSTLFASIGDLLVSRSGLFNFSHGHLKSAVERRYIFDESLKR